LNPELWFFQVESAFQMHRIRGDESKYHMVVSKLDTDSLQEVADIIMAPPAENKYDHLKTAILNRFTDSADRQLRRLLTQVELGDKKPSQLLRQMKTLTGDRASEDVLRVKWLDLLPVSSQRFLRIFKASSLDELATAADELVDGGQSVLAVSPSARAVSPARAPLSQPPASSVVNEGIASLRLSISQLISLNRDILNHLKSGSASSGSRSGCKCRSRSQSPAPDPMSDTCYYHQR